MTKTLNDLDDNMIGTRIRILYTPVEGVLEYFNLDYEEDVKVIINGSTYYLPREFPVSESITDEEYDPSVLLGVVEPWSPFDGL